MHFLEVASLLINIELLQVKYQMITHGSFILMKTLHIKNEMRIQTNDMQSSRILFSLGVVGLFV